MTENVEYPPPTTVDQLRRLLEQLPGDALVLVDGYEAAYASIATAALTEVQELSGRPSYLGRFEHPEDAARAVAGDDAAGWISEPGPLPQLVGEPVMALVLRREVRDGDEQ
ncbi:Uncharacterised protein [Mycobacteroides abscessus subsp. massiliense]|uniref:hypothetical protein n=1 Tax=Mycobacteroides abscessus TaxID=36809 RepID=UPI0009A8B7DC|nr:hypothetical protein [Mycobacteroides abscessus]SKE69339.1 Uncharacterised protein [Mycobacteroides abscessus subsp. massiliense]SKH81447.1 Uncharacterised protein [Mycobacteroides abscessus subsp. massiliense]SKI34697.1 Uncharacterised protein [Mycobacteroides abscessus subsp. massiliense]SKJ35525.1 Uncharacterised protein [Mycobacteroides abscessus subsp. massiliense]SKK24247.1 Uncharacterised protein [Mycobacteroides abscessus subsp. massiliense]